MSDSRKYHLNELFFDTWSPEMAYVLGFWYADGHMRKDRSYRIFFTSNDKDILEDIRQALCSTNLIRKSKQDKSFQLAVYSKHMYRTIEAIGGSMRKSRILKFPKVPHEYLRDFIRGYFDGDGSVFFVEYTRTKDGCRTRELRTNFTSGSRVFLEELMIILHDKIGFPLKVLGVFNDGSSLKLGYGMKDSDALLRCMYYEGFSIGLQRKAIFVSMIPIYQKHIIPQKFYSIGSGNIGSA